MKSVWIRRAFWRCSCGGRPRGWQIRYVCYRKIWTMIPSGFISFPLGGGRSESLDGTYIHRKPTSYGNRFIRFVWLLYVTIKGGITCAKLYYLVQTPPIALITNRLDPMNVRNGSVIGCGAGGPSTTLSSAVLFVCLVIDCTAIHLFPWKYVILFNKRCCCTRSCHSDILIDRFFEHVWLI